MSIPVKATKKGYFGKLREVGEKFEVEREEQLGSWMQRLDGAEGTETEHGGDDLDKMSAADLKAKAKEMGVEGVDNLKKDEVINAIKAKQESE